MRKKVNVFWENNSCDLVAFHQMLIDEGLLDNLVYIDEDDNDGTGYYVEQNFVDEFKELVEQYNLIWEAE